MQKHPPIQLMKTVKPGNDFNKYVNGIWEQHAKLSPIFNSTGVFREMQTIADDCLLDAIYKIHLHKGHLSQKEKRDNLLINLKESVDKFPHSHKNIASLQKKISEIQCLRSKEEVVQYIGYLNVLGCPSMVFFMDNEDPEDTRKVYWSFNVGYYSLGDTSLYRNDKYGTPQFWKSYRNYINYLEVEWRQDNSLSDIIDLERKFDIDLNKEYYKEEKRNRRKYIYTGEELSSKYSAFPWDSYFKGLGIQGWKTIKILFRDSSHALIKTLLRYLEKENLSTWKNWLTLLVLNHGIQFTTPELAERWHNFFYKGVSALPQRKTGEELFLSTAKSYAHIALNDLYRDHCFTKSKKDGLKPLFNNMISSSIDLIESADWMRLTTREHAKRKVEKMGVEIAYPEGKYNYEYPELSPDHLLENIYTLANTNYRSLEESIKHPPLRKVWTKPIFNVNAHYSSNMNRIIFPAAILESPFYVEYGSIGWNYGGIGATVGHEITHAFDRDGMLIDENGKKETWYTDKDKEEYDKRAEDLIHIFSKVREYGHKLDTPYIISEAIADLGGLGIALHALKKELRRIKADETDTAHEIRNFFIGYAVTWRSKTRPKFAIQRVFTDEHPPAWTRVNYIVQHFQEFYDIFHVTKGDDLYLEPKNRIRFF